MKLSPRLQTIVKHIPINSICADIGTDHGYVPIHIIRNKISPKVIATDINKGPLTIAKKQIQLVGLEKRIDTRLGDGLKPIKPFEVETIIIGGMGGILIKNILESSMKVTRSANTLILQPMIGQRELREYLVSNNFKIINEDLAKEGKRIYEIIIATHGKQKIQKDLYFEIGRPLVQNKHPLLPMLIKHKKNQYKKIILQCEGNISPNVEVKIRECNVKLDQLREVEKCL